MKRKRYNRMNGDKKMQSMHDIVVLKSRKVVL